MDKMTIASWPDDVRQFIDDHASSFDQTLPWLECFEREILDGSPGIWLVVDRSEPGGVTGLLPLRMGQVSLFGRWSSPAVTAPSNYYTALFGPVCGADADRRTIDSLVTSTIEMSDRVGVVDLNPLDADSQFLASCVEGFSNSEWLVEVYSRFGNWIEPVEGRTFAEFLRDRPGQVRSTLSRKGKKLRAMPGAVLSVVTEAADVGEAMRQYETVYRQSWKTDEPYQEFIRDVARRFADRGWLRLGLLTVDGLPAAAQIWFVYRGVASIFKLAYDPRYVEMSVGSLLTARMFEHVIDVDRVRVVDYLCGDDAYKRDWMTVRRQRVGFRAARRWTMPWVTEQGRRWAKSAFRR